MRPEQSTQFDRRDVEAFIRHARHALHAGGLSRPVHQSVTFRLTSLVHELDELEPRWDLMRAWAREVRELLRHFAQAATVSAMDGLRWP